MRYVIGSIITLLLLVGCAKSTEPLEQQMQHHTEEQIKFSTVKNEKIIDQQPANKAKEIVASFEEITKVYAVNSKKELLIAFDVSQIHRFGLDTIKKDVKKRLEKEMNNMKIEVSTDEKIRLELEKLEHTLHEKNMNNQTVEEKIKKLISLSKEET